MIVTIKLSPPGKPALQAEFRVDRIVYWRTDAVDHETLTTLFFDDGPPALVLGDHAEVIRAAVEVTASKVDEDVELIAALRAEVEDLKRRVIALEGKPDAVA
jgi:hypothetical protein